MSSRPLNAVLQHLRAAGERDGAGRTDGELLTRFLNQRDDQALAALIERHAPMVWGVCRRVLHNLHEAEDAFQATFLVFVRKASTIKSRELVANWLYGVAHQTAIRLRATAARRGMREMQIREMPEPVVAEDRPNELLPILDQELSLLPEKHRALIVLCDLEGKTRKEAARQLGCPEGTVASRLARARELLAKRVARHGLAITSMSLVASLTQSTTSGSVPFSLVTSTIKVATLHAVNQAVGVISGPVAALTDEVLKTMLLKKIMTTTMVVLAVSVAIITGGSLTIGQTVGAGQPMDQQLKDPFHIQAVAKPSDPPKAQSQPPKQETKRVKLLVQLRDNQTGKPIENATFEWGWVIPEQSQQFYGGSQSGNFKHANGQYELQLSPLPTCNTVRVRVFAAGYETSLHTEGLRTPIPESANIEINLRTGRDVVGTLRDHEGKPVADGQVFFIPEGRNVRIVEGVPDTSTLSEARSDAQGKFKIRAGGKGKLAASTATVDLWPFAIAEYETEKNLTLPASTYLSLNLDYWYFAGNDKPGNSIDNPEECRLLVQRLDDTPAGWEKLDYHRQMLVFAVDPKAILARGVKPWGLSKTVLAPIDGVGEHRRIQVTVKIALQPGRYSVQRTTSAGPFGNDVVTLKEGTTTPLDWKQKFGDSVRGMVTLPANHQFIQHPGATPRKLDWTVPMWAYVHIVNADGKRCGGAKIQPDGSFRIDTHFEPGRYRVQTWMLLPQKDNVARLGELSPQPDLEGDQEFIIPEPPADPAGVLPVNVDLTLKIHGKRIIP